MGVAIQPIFKDASQALRLSYAIEAYPATPQSQMGSVIRTLMRQCGIPAEHRQPSADFGNMTPLEVRAELGKLREIVKMQLNIIEARALQAKYSQNQGEQYKAMRTIWDHLRPVVAHVAKDHELVFSVVERHYQPEENRDAQWSVRAIADKFKVSKDRVFRLAKLVEQHIGQLELVALDNLRRELEQSSIAPAISGIMRICSAAMPRRQQNRHPKCQTRHDMYFLAIGSIVAGIVGILLLIWVVKS